MHITLLYTHMYRTPHQSHITVLYIGCHSLNRVLFLHLYVFPPPAPSLRVISRVDGWTPEAVVVAFSEPISLLTYGGILLMNKCLKSASYHYWLVFHFCIIKWLLVTHCVIIPSQNDVNMQQHDSWVIRSIPNIKQLLQELSGHGKHDTVPWVRRHCFS